MAIITCLTIFLSSCESSRISEDQSDILNKLLAGEDTSMHVNRLYDVETPYTLCFQNSDDSVSVYIFPYPISYRNSVGKFVLINTSLTEVKDSNLKDSFALQSETGVVTNRYPQTSNDNFLITKDGKTMISFAFGCEQNAGYKKTVFQDCLGCERDSVSYSICGEIELQCIPVSYGIKAVFTINEPINNGKMSFSLDKQAVDGIVNNGNNIIIIPKDDKSQRCVARCSYFEDLTGKVGFVDQITVQETTDTIECVIPANDVFLSRKDIVYPVSFGVTFEVLPDSMQTVNVYTNSRTDYLSDYSVIGADESYGNGTMFMKFKIGHFLKTYEQNVKSASLSFVDSVCGKSGSTIRFERINKWWDTTTPFNEMPDSNGTVNSVYVMEEGKYKVDITEYIKACIYDDTLNTENYGLLVSSTEGSQAIISNYNNSLYPPYVRIDFYEIPWKFEKVEEIN